MLVRFSLKNIFSFDEEKEFNMFPNTALRTLQTHKNEVLGIKLLKLAALYGANGAGKSNLINAMGLLQDAVISTEIPIRLSNSRFKFSDKKQPQQLFVEFVEQGQGFCYILHILDDIVLEEALYKSGLGMDDDELIYHRTTEKDKKTVNVEFMPAFEKDEKSQMLKSILIQSFFSPTKPIFKLLSEQKNPYLDLIQQAYNWFKNTLRIIKPSTKPAFLAADIDANLAFKNYAKSFMESLHIGISGLVAVKHELKNIFGDVSKEQEATLRKNVEESTFKMLGVFHKSYKQLVLVKENDELVVKQLFLQHKGGQEQEVLFSVDEESDGTIRLLDFLPVFESLSNEPKVFFIDEIERSLHPVLVKELVKKFSLDAQTQGQLIFSTHESNLLDQEIFRQDEIWFVEKNQKGATDLYSLSDFKEHKTIDIQKGYLTGRYGAIPFLGNLQTLNWHREG